MSTLDRRRRAALTDRIVRNAKARILRDVANGAVPRDVRDFVDLQEHVDANVYLLLRNEHFYPGTSPLSRHGAAILENASDRISEWIAGGGLKRSGSPRRARR